MMLTITIWQLLFGCYTAGALAAFLMIAISACTPGSTTRDDLFSPGPSNKKRDVTIAVLVCIVLAWFIVIPWLLWELLSAPKGDDSA